MTSTHIQHVVPRNRSRKLSLASPRFSLQHGTITPQTYTIATGMFILIIFGLLGFFYLQQVLYTASEGNDIHAMEIRIADLKEKQRDLELEGAQLRSIQHVEDTVKRLNLVTTDHVAYLTAPGSSNQVAVAAEPTTF